MKKMWKTALALVMAAGMTISCFPAPVSAETTGAQVTSEVELPYVDVTETDWFYDSVYYNYDAGTMTGMDETHFGPYHTLSRAQFALILYRMEGKPEVDTESPFRDISGAEWYGQAVLWAQENGIVTGYLDGNFGPADIITREQMAVMMYRYAKYKGYDVSAEGDYTTFEDAQSVSGFAQDAMDWVVGMQIITGKEGNLLDPVAGTARAEAAVIIHRFMTAEMTPAPEYVLPGIVENGTAADEQGVLIQVPNAAIEENCMQDIYLFQDQLLTCVSVGTTLNFRLLSLDTGEVLHEKAVSLAGEYNYTYNVQVCGDQIAVSDPQAGKIYVLDETLECVKEYDVTGDFLYVNEELTAAYSFYSDAGIQMTNLETGETSTLISGVYNLNSYLECGDSVSFSCEDDATGDNYPAALNLETGNIETLVIDERFDITEYSNGEWLALISETGGTQYLLGRQSEPKKLILKNSDSSLNLLGEPNRIMSTAYDFEDGCSMSLSLYNMKGKFLSSVNVSDVYIGPTMDPVWMESANGYFFTTTDEQGHDHLYFWDLSKSVEGTRLDVTDYYGEAAVSQALYDRAKQLGDQYGVKINIADKCKTAYSDTNVELELDEAVIEKGLNWLEMILADYPENFFRQLLFEGYSDPIEINLVGNMERNYESVYNVVGFVSQRVGYFALVMNTDRSEFDEFSTTFYHEVSHIIDKKLQYDAEQGTNTLYSEEGWNALNPEGFQYADSYETAPEYKEEYFAYFFDDYSLTFSTEDRARILENAMNGNAYYFNTRECAGRNAKLEYYCECIRASFDTTGWPEVTKWEQALIDCDTALPPATGKG